LSRGNQDNVRNAMKEKIRIMVEDGFAIRRIAKLLQISDIEIKDLIKNDDYVIKKEKFKETDIPDIIALYTAGVSAKSLGIKYSIDKRRVLKWAKEKGILRSKNDSHRITFFNQKYFDEINTPGKAYWLGFLYADAYNCKITNTTSVTLSEKDIDHLYKLCNSLELDNSKVIKFNVKNKDKIYPSCYVSLYSKHICETLSKQGCPQAKSFILKYPEWLPNDLNSHFIRGYFDGDGCLTFRKKQREWKWSLVSTKEMCESIRKILIDEIGISTTLSYISQTDNNTYEMQTSGNMKIHSIMNWLYASSTDEIRLSRKYDKYNELELQQRNKKGSINGK